MISGGGNLFLILLTLQTSLTYTRQHKGNEGIKINHIFAMERHW